MKKIYSLSALLLNVLLFQAQIVYNDIPDITETVGSRAVPFYEFAPMDFNNDGTPEYKFSWFYNGTTMWNLNIRHSATDARTAQQTGPFNFRLHVLAENEMIGPALYWPNLDSPYVSNQNTPLFQAQGDRYIGVQFKIGANTHYGWILINFTNLTLIVKSFAYQSTPNTTIAAGDKGTLAVSETVKRENMIKLYPNPAKDYVMVKGMGEFEYTIIDMAGKMVQSGNSLAEKEINTTKLPRGNYFVKLKNLQGNISVKKLIIE